MKKITLLLVDDHQLIRDSWSFVLNNDGRFEVIASTGAGDVAVALAETLQPDVILMDVNMIPMNGFEATKHIRDNMPLAKIIGVSMHSMPAYAKRLMQQGAMGYVTKNSTKEELIEAIIDVYNGKKYICQEVAAAMSKGDEQEEAAGQSMNNLSKRELDIVKLIKEGFSSKEIAQKLDIALKTVEVHRYNILKKLNLRNTASLVNFINVHGL